MAEKRAGAAGAPKTAGLRVGETVELLEISRAWLVDPVAGREGPGEIVVRDGILDGRHVARGRRGGRDRRRTASS